jgi:hypothetical protein
MKNSVMKIAVVYFFYQFAIVIYRLEWVIVPDTAPSWFPNPEMLWRWIVVL